MDWIGEIFNLKTSSLQIYVAITFYENECHTYDSLYFSD